MHHLNFCGAFWARQMLWQRGVRVWGLGWGLCLPRWLCFAHGIDESLITYTVLTECNVTSLTKSLAFIVVLEDIKEVRFLSV